MIYFAHLFPRNTLCSIILLILYNKHMINLRFFKVLFYFTKVSETLQNELEFILILKCAASSVKMNQKISISVLF